MPGTAALDATRMAMRRPESPQHGAARSAGRRQADRTPTGIGGERDDSSGANRRISNASGPCESSSTGWPQRDSPTSAPSLAVSVASVSADGRARSSSEYWSTRPGAGSTSIVTMSIAAGGGCDSRSSTSSVRSTFGIAHGGRQLQHARMPRAIDEPQFEMDGRGAAIGALERRRQRLEQPREHERQRLQPVDRPLELDALEKARHIGIGHERTRIDSARHPLKSDAGLPEPRRQRPGRERRQLAERRTPSVCSASNAMR